MPMGWGGVGEGVPAICNPLCHTQNQAKIITADLLKTISENS